jgi:hypothetical protein
LLYLLVGRENVNMTVKVTKKPSKNGMRKRPKAFNKTFKSVGPEDYEPKDSITNPEVIEILLKVKILLEEIHEILKEH